MFHCFTGLHSSIFFCQLDRHSKSIGAFSCSNLGRSQKCRSTLKLAVKCGSLEFPDYNTIKIVIVKPNKKLLHRYTSRLILLLYICKYMSRLAFIFIIASHLPYSTEYTIGAHCKSV